MENLSCLVSDVLDCIGYSQNTINVRRNFWQHFAHLINQTDPSWKLIVAGSKAEGITSYYESDVDVMNLYNDAISTDSIQLSQHLSAIPDTTVLQAETRDAPPGYTRLRLLSCNGAGSRSFLMDCAFESESKHMYISSSLFASIFMQAGRRANIPCNNLSGPALSVSNDSIISDHVIAFSCFHSKLLQTWKSRRRLHNWPPADVREIAASMLPQVVPIGSKRSDDQWREWRFCFIESELTLTFSLNETQIKLYILLKMVAKDVLRNVSDAVSSYIMKNVTFWVSELVPEQIFRKENLLSLLLLSLRFLRSAITYWKWLPYYMIPGRNLLAERLSHDSRRQFSDLLDTLIEEGPRLILRCTKLHKALTIFLTSPATLIDYGNKRNMIEQLIHIEIIQVDESVLENIIIKRFDLILPEWRKLLVTGVPAENIISFLMNQTVSILS